MLIFQILLGWPAIVSSLLISSAGIILRRPNWLLLGAVLITGFAWYLTASPAAIFKLLGLSLPLLHLAAWYYLGQGLRWKAGICLLPHLAIAIFFGTVVLSQNP